MKPLHNLHLRLFLPFALALITATALAWWTATSLLTQTLEQRLEVQLERAGEVLASGAFPLTRDLLLRLGRLLKADITLVASDGALGPSTIDSNGPASTGQLARDWETLLRRGRPAVVQAGPTPYMLVVRRLPPARDQRYQAVVVAAAMGDIRAAVRQTALWLGLLALAGTLILAWVGHRIVIGITRPVQQLATMSDRIANGERDIQVQVAQANELGQLAASLNAMARRLQTYEQEIAQRNRLAALGTMAARIAHEVRNPLTAIKLQLQLLGESLPGEDHDTVEALLQEVARLELIVSSTLSAGRKEGLTPVPVDLNDLLGDVVRLFQPQFAHRGIQLESKFQEPLPQATLDPNRTKQILVNLLVNAGEALQQGGRIRVGTEYRTDSGEVAFSVEDSGPGVPEEQRAGLFAGGESEKPSGLGIGLRLSRELVEQQGGRIEVEDSPLGGARFLVRFSVSMQDITPLLLPTRGH